MDWRIWSPLQSPTVKSIYCHMTKDEKKTFFSYAMFHGGVVAIFSAVPLSLGLTFLRSRLFGITGIVLLVWLAIGVFVLIRQRRRVKEFLCSTQWAESKKKSL